MSLAFVRPAGKTIELVFQSDEPGAKPQIHLISALQALRLSQGLLDEAVRLIVNTPPPGRDPNLDDYPQ